MKGDAEAPLEEAPAEKITQCVAVIQAPRGVAEAVARTEANLAELA